MPQPFVVDVRDDWAPYGAARFVELVQDKALDGSAFHRAGTGFLTQFGISPNLALREKWTGQTIPDDVNRHMCVANVKANAYCDSVPTDATPLSSNSIRPSCA